MAILIEAIREAGEMLSERAKGSIKACLGRVMLSLRMHQRMCAEQGVVVAFHRVNSSGDLSGLTVSPEIFERFCRFFGEYFQVVPLSYFVDRLERRESVADLLAITFDDGYRDNYEIAAPILKRLNFPATFFITTSFIETDLVPFWDKQAGVVFPWMSWDQVVALHRQGFEIGAHTRNHVDLGITTGDLALDEIHGSRQDLEFRLAAPVTLFAYPFGRASQMTDQNRSKIAAAGFRCCCSCYGGVNTSSTDPFVLRRVAISNWFTSPFQFAFEFATLQI